MSDELKIPKELQHMLEKRKHRGRRRDDLPPAARGSTPATPYKGPERRKRRRRK